MAFDGPMFDEWREDAVCQRIVKRSLMSEKELLRYFYPTRNSNSAASASAKRICHNHCPVREECLTDALMTGDRYGIRGGVTADDRREIRSMARVGIRKLGTVEDYLDLNEHRAEPALALG